MKTLFILPFLLLCGCDTPAHTIEISDGKKSVKITIQQPRQSISVGLPGIPGL